MKKYEAGAEFLLREVIPGLKPGDKIPPELELSRRAGVSLMTLRRSIELLCERGILSRIPEHRAVVDRMPGGEGEQAPVRSILIVCVADDLFFKELIMQIQQYFIDNRGRFRLNPVIRQLPKLHPENGTELDDTFADWIVKTAVRERVHAVLLIPAWTLADKVEKRLDACRIPMAALSPTTPCRNSIYVDQAAGAYTGLEHLYQCGCRHIWHFGLKRTQSCFSRYAGVVKFFRDYFPGLPESEWLVESRGLIDEGYNAFSRFIESGRTADGILAHNDLCSVGIIMAARKYGFELPERLAVMGFDNISRLGFLMPDLTSIAQPCDHLAEEMLRTFEYMLSAPDSLNFSSRAAVPARLCIRRSTIGFLYGSNLGGEA